MLRFGVTVLLSAFLLFLVQPLIGRYILPWFGGGSGVWSACLLFFQGALVIGYAYAYLLARWLPLRRQAIVHLIVLAATLAALPIAPDARWKPSAETEPVGSILMLLLTCIGAPYAALATTGPLMQSWFARSFPKRSPYRLYAVSNLGSLLALPAYPLLIEPLLGRTGQTLMWSGAYVIFAIAAAWCAIGVLRQPAPRGPDAAPAEAQEAGRATVAMDRLMWLLLPACGSVMLISTTAVLTDEITPAPFIWVVPLGAYLLSFIVAFEWPRAYRRDVFVPLLAIVIGLVVATQFERQLRVLPLALIHTAAVFVVCMVCHGELYRLRPSVTRLTGFYLGVAIGGAAGAVFVTVAAPRLFDGYAEYVAAIFGSIGLLGICMFRDVSSPFRAGANRPAWLGMILATMVLGYLWSVAGVRNSAGTILQSRSFYGVIRVRELERDNPFGHRLELSHGRISHGAQFVAPEGRRRPTCYYGPATGGGRAVLVIGRRQFLRVGVVGLGVGTLATYGRRGDVYRFYEINPDVTRVAETTFTFLADSLATCEIVPGDARLSMEAEPPQEYDVLVVDAFSGDAIPFHLLTRESIAEYRRHLKPGGVIALHLTNRYLDLIPIARSLADDAGLGFRFMHSELDRRRLDLESFWVLLSTDHAFLDDPAIAGAASQPESRPSPRLWTDEHVRVLDALR